jgi:hypothetical protein
MQYWQPQLIRLQVLVGPLWNAFWTLFFLIHFRTKLNCIRLILFILFVIEYPLVLGYSSKHSVGSSKYLESVCSFCIHTHLNNIFINYCFDFGAKKYNMWFWLCEWNFSFLINGCISLCIEIKVMYFVYDLRIIRNKYTTKGIWRVL